MPMVLPLVPFAATFLPGLEAAEGIVLFRPKTGKTAAYLLYVAFLNLINHTILLPPVIR